MVYNDMGTLRIRHYRRQAGQGRGAVGGPAARAGEMEGARRRRWRRQRAPMAEPPAGRGRAAGSWVNRGPWPSRVCATWPVGSGTRPAIQEERGQHRVRICISSS